MQPEVELMQPVAHEQRPLGELFSELARETGTLVRQEVQLAKTEMVAKTKVAAVNVGWTAAGAVIVFAGTLALMAAAISALALVMPIWLSALIVGVMVSGIGASLALHGLHALKHLDPVPRQTIKTLKEDRRWVSEQMSR